MAHWTSFAIGVVCCVTLCSQFAASSQVHSMSQNKVFKDDYGNFTNCGSAGTHFQLDWTPRVLKPGIDVTVDFNLETEHSFEHGMVCVTVWLQDVQDPIYQACNDQSCEDALKIIKQYVPSFSCPLPAGFGVSFKKFKYHIQPTIPLLSGKYKIHADIKNQDKKDLLCVDGKVELIDE